MNSRCVRYAVPNEDYKLKKISLGLNVFFLLLLRILLFIELHLKFIKATIPGLLIR